MPTEVPPGRGRAGQADAPSQDAQASADPVAQDVEAVLAACRSLVAISALSVTAVASEVNLVQLRILVLLASRDVASLGDLARLMGLHITRASRMCDRLVRKGLLTRQENTEDRRVLRVALTPSGRHIVDQVTQARRQAIAPILASMSPTARKELARSLRAFANASGALGPGVPNVADPSALGWQAWGGEPG
ncbi:MarR family winged helix-turn-helix transcriptional regulator [Lapillicoccus jejuensis]|uniref:DNA-binding MarR family transcriptional regulator n=1 Tax=Lapillicoccus jejuensis TaxID=402171 RepID=A0A542E610_9MICO|nr:MarR family transcriptional regulator [Lapillicoccus jejuensis]TQJ10709.1 DNA-binding MarR family transcriptional regulator [Lapillicoccus jejuensis]